MSTKPVQKPEPSPSLVDRAKHLVLGDDSGPTPITTTLIYANFAVYIVMALMTRSTGAIWEMPDATTRVFGANIALYTIGDTRVETLVTSCFLHGGLLHIAFNMIALRQVGPFVERSVGPARFLPLYLLSGTFGSVASAIAGWSSHAGRASVGASGAICGVIGAAMVLGLRTQGIRGPLATGMARWLGGILLIGYALPLADNWAHVGGAAAGAVIAALWHRGRTYSPVAEKVIVCVMTLLVVGCFAEVYRRDTRDPYVLQDENQRRRAAQHYMVHHQCDQARMALARAAALHPKSTDTRDMELDLMRHCP